MSTHKNGQQDLLLYPKWSLIVFCFFLTFIGPALMFWYNLKQAGRGKWGFIVIFMSMFSFGLVIEILRHITPDVTLQASIANLLVGPALAFPVWTSMMPKDLDYVHKSVWLPIICGVVFWSGMVLLVSYYA